MSTFRCCYRSCMKIILNIPLSILSLPWAPLAILTSTASDCFILWDVFSIFMSNVNCFTSILKGRILIDPFIHAFIHPFMHWYAKYIPCYVICMLSDSILVPVVDSFSYRYVHILIVNMKLYIDNHMHTPKKKTSKHHNPSAVTPRYYASHYSWRSSWDRDTLWNSNRFHSGDDMVMIPHLQLLRGFLWDFLRWQEYHQHVQRDFQRSMS